MMEENQFHGGRSQVSSLLDWDALRSSRWRCQKGSCIYISGTQERIWDRVINGGTKAPRISCSKPCNSSVVEPWLNVHLFAAWPSMSLMLQREKDKCGKLSLRGRHTPFPLPRWFCWWWKFKAKILEEYSHPCLLFNFTCTVRFEISVYILIWYFPYI